MLVGLGLDYGDISLRALKSIKNADFIYFEKYTSTISDKYIQFLKDEVGHDIVQINRSDLEEKSSALVKKAVNSIVALLVPGDPLVATTHHILIESAYKAGVAVEVYHSSSILSAAIGESGLDIYKFGPTTTIPFWKDNYKPISFIDTINKNVVNGNHTMVLMDYDQSTGATVQLSEAIERLLFSEKERGYKIFNERRIMAMFDIGKPTCSITMASTAELLDVYAKAVKRGMLTIIVPGKMSFAEEELSSRFLQDVRK
ncbi:diphthine synthase [Candidatus Marsarchaeota archaeon]|nr:diphthine synthase [Candidatus Marsarchaeota archaeon]